MFLVNGQLEPDDNKDRAWLFQPEITVEAPEDRGDKSVFRRRPSNEVVVDDPERDRLALIYRKRLEFAVGHGVSVHADTTPEDPTKAHRVRTEIIPRYEVAVTETPGLDPRDRPAMRRMVDEGWLDMTRLAEMAPDALRDALSCLVDDYAVWIGEQSLHQLVSTPAARAALDRLITAWKQTEISGDVLAGILVGAAFARQRAQCENSVELVWTGPTTPLVATRRTEQVLLDLIGHAKSDLFLVSFVAYGVSSVVDALNAAIARGVATRILLETSTTHGGNLSVDPIATMRRCVPSAALYVWTDRPAPFDGGSVHAKAAVADGKTAFITSANLTGYALEKNMEAGVVISGGHVPTDLQAHLHALVETKVIRKIDQDGHP